MSKPIFKVRKSGLLSTIQDRGRKGYQQYGIVVSGSMDPFSMNVANFLVGNKGDKAVLEITVMGPAFDVLDDAVIAICGGDLSPKVNGEKAPMWKSFTVKEGDRLEFGQPLSGARSYISVAGGYEVPLVMGSKSTYLKAGIGGVEGRALVKGDVLQTSGKIKGISGRALHPDEVPSYKKELTVRVVLGPHQHAFTEEGIHTFLSTPYEVTPQSDRMGFRLKGEKVEHATSADIISEAIPLGGIQVPANGDPIILMSDRQTTGGYTRIATVISSDIPYLAQAMPGCKIHFSEVTVEQAQEVFETNDRFLRTLEKVSVR